MKCDVDVGSLSCLIMRSLIAVSGSSVGGSWIRMKTRFSLVLRYCRSRMVSFMVLFSVVTEVGCVLIEESLADMVERSIGAICFIVQDYQFVVGCIPGCV